MCVNEIFTHALIPTKGLTDSLLNLVEKAVSTLICVLEEQVENDQRCSLVI